MNTKLRLGIAAICATLLIPSIALAQGKRKERRQDKREIRQDKKEMVDDRLDHARLVKLLRDFNEYARTRNRRGLDNVDSRLKKMLREEMRQNHVRHDAFEVIERVPPLAA